MRALGPFASGYAFAICCAFTSRNEFDLRPFLPPPSSLHSYLLLLLGQPACPPGLRVEPATRSGAREREHARKRERERREGTCFVIHSIALKYGVHSITVSHWQTQPSVFTCRIPLYNITSKHSTTDTCWYYKREYSAVNYSSKSRFPNTLSSISFPTQQLSHVKSPRMSAEAQTNRPLSHLLCPVSQQYCRQNINQSKQHNVLETYLNSQRELK